MSKSQLFLTNHTWTEEISNSVARWLGVTALDDIEQALWDVQRLRQEDTATWIFDDHNYVSWSSRSVDLCTQSDVLSNALWICGQSNPAEKSKTETHYL